MNLINTILILIIIIFLINHFSNGQIIITLKRIYNSCINNVESFTGKQTLCYKPNVFDIPFANQLDFPYINNSDISNLDKETYELYEFINNVVTKNINLHELSPSSPERIKLDNNIQNNIVKLLLNLFNDKNYSFNNIKLNQDIYYYNNYKGKEFEPIIFTADIMKSNKYMNSYTFLINCFLIQDEKNNKLYINNLKIIKKNISDKIKDISFQKNKEMNTKMNNTFNDIPIHIPNNNDLFIKPAKKVTFENNENNDTDASLIPSINIDDTCY